MSLSGSDKVATRPRGGVEQVLLIPAGSFVRAVEDPAGESLSRFESSQTPAEYAFREDRASYSETLLRDGMQCTVKHTLVMELPSGGGVHRAAGELARRSDEGFVAVVTKASRERIVVGYSSRFGVRYPLRVTRMVSASGSAAADFPSVEITLESIDADISKGLI